MQMATKDSFKEYLPVLRELQKIDARIREVTAALQVISGERQEKGADYLSIKGSLDQKETEFSKITFERLNLERQSQEMGTEIHRREERLNGIKTQQEYQATIKEIAQIKQTNKERETRILVLMEQGEKLNEEITQLKSQATDKEGDFQALEKQITEQEASLKMEETQILERRPELLKGLPAMLLKKYDTSRKRYINGIAVVLRGICQGCFMGVPPQFFNEMVKYQDLRQCPKCSRLIYALLEPEVKEGDIKKENKED